MKGGKRKDYEERIKGTIAKNENKKVKGRNKRCN